MARRAAAGGGRGGRARGRDAKLEVIEEETGPSGPTAGFETGIVAAALAALVLAFIVIQIKLGDFGAGLFG